MGGMPKWGAVDLTDLALGKGFNITRNNSKIKYIYLLFERHGYLECSK